MNKRAKNCCTKCTTTAPRCKSVRCNLLSSTAPHRVYRNTVQWCSGAALFDAFQVIKSSFVSKALADSLPAVFCTIGGAA